MLPLRVSLLVLLLLVASSSLAQGRRRDLLALNAQCKPTNGMTQAACKKRAAICKKLGITMAWVGATKCKTTTGAKAGDGGCQCSAAAE